MLKTKLTKKGNTMVGSNLRTLDTLTFIEQSENLKTMDRKPLYCDIWMCRLEGQPGSSIQSGYRPVLVISNDKNNLHSPLVNVIPLTSKGNKRGLPVHVNLDRYDDYGLSMPSTVLCEQVTSIPTKHLDRYIGNIFDEVTRAKIKRALEIQFSFIH